MTLDTKRPGAHTFVALELSLELIDSLRDVVALIRKRDLSLAQQIVRSASSIAANLGEAGGRQGKDRLHFFRIAAGSAEETKVHLRVALAWGWVQQSEVEASIALINRELAILWRLTH